MALHSVSFSLDTIWSFVSLLPPWDDIICRKRFREVYYIQHDYFLFLIYLYLCYSFSNDAMLLAGGQSHILQVDLHVPPESQTIWIVNPYSVYTRV